MAVLGVVVTASPAWAQDPPPVVITGGLDLVNRSNFRGIRQNTEGVSIWPYVDFGFTPFMGDGGLKTVGVNLGTWNAFNTEIDGFTNRDGETTSNKWYESDLYRDRQFRVRRACARGDVYVVHEPRELVQPCQGTGVQGLRR